VDYQSRHAGCLLFLVCESGFGGKKFNFRESLFSPPFFFLLSFLSPFRIEWMPEFPSKPLATGCARARISPPFPDLPGKREKTMAAAPFFSPNRCLLSPLRPLVFHVFPEVAFPKTAFPFPRAPPRRQRFEGNSASTRCERTSLSFARAGLNCARHNTGFKRNPPPSSTMLNRRFFLSHTRLAGHEFN